MSAAGQTLTRASICVTCLSQDRKLFPVNDSKLVTLLIDVSEEDKLCWECHFFILKVAAFRSQAARAQTLLANALNKQASANEVSSLSRLKMGPVTHKDSLDPPDPLQVTVKIEPVDTVKEETDQFYECSIEMEEVDEDLSYNRKVTVSLLPLFDREAKTDEVSGGEVIGDDTDKASLKLPSCRKDSSTEMPEQVKKTEIDNTVSKDKADVEGLSDLAPMAKDYFTVKIMDKEELMRWRQRKKSIDYYTTSFPDLRCEQCIEPFRSISQYAAHSKRHEEEFGAFECDICGLRSVNEMTLTVHTTQHYSLLTCTLCGFEWDSPNPMRQHCSVAHAIPVTVWDCDQCDGKFPSARKLARHVMMHRVVTCPDCGKQVGWNSLKTHKRLHEEDGIPLRTCPVCGGRYRGDQGLAAHMTTHDDKVDEEAFCADCNIQFRSKNIYRNHLRYTRKHAQAQPRFKCEYCGKCFQQRAYWKSHVDSMHNNERKHACYACGQLFKTRNKKREHERSKHEGVRRARDKICDYCGKGFMTKKILQQHINTHTGARPFACRLCDATFGFDSALFLHGRFKHGINQNRRKKLDQD